MCYLWWIYALFYKDTLRLREASFSNLLLSLIFLFFSSFFACSSSFASWVLVKGRVARRICEWEKDKNKKKFISLFSLYKILFLFFFFHLYFNVKQIFIFKTKENVSSMFTVHWLYKKSSCLCCDFVIFNLLEKYIFYLFTECFVVQLFLASN